MTSNKKNLLKFLLSSSLAEINKRGSLTNEIKMSSESIKEIRNIILNKNDKINFELEVVSLLDSKTAQPVVVELNINYPES